MFKKLVTQKLIVAALCVAALDAAIGTNTQFVFAQADNISESKQQQPKHLLALPTPKLFPEHFYIGICDRLLAPIRSPLNFDANKIERSLMHQKIVRIKGMRWDKTGATTFLISFANGDRGIFKTTDQEKNSFRYEVVAYEIAKVLGFSGVPPTVFRKIKVHPNQEPVLGSLQYYIPNASTAFEYKSVPIIQNIKSNPYRMKKYAKDIAIDPEALFLDLLIQNYDRHAFNLIYRPFYKEGQIYAQQFYIDHSRSFVINDNRNVYRLYEVSQTPKPEWLRILADTDNTVWDQVFEKSMVGAWQRNMFQSQKALLLRKFKSLL